MNMLFNENIVKHLHDEELSHVEFNGMINRYNTTVSVEYPKDIQLEFKGNGPHNLFYEISRSRFTYIIIFSLFVSNIYS